MNDGPLIGALRPGALLGSRYRVEKTLGRGGFAITYLCRAGAYDKAYAVKEFLPLMLAGRNDSGLVEPFEPEDRELFDRNLADFMNEGRRLMACRHPNVVQVEDCFEENGTAYLVMEYLEGGTLREYLDSHGILAPASLMRILLPLTDALQNMHEQGLLHRDLTPSNIVLRRKDLGAPVLIDFGAARHASAHRSANSSQVCSDGYSPPEQYRLQSECGPYSDVYALGCVAYNCLTADRPPLALDRLANDAIDLPRTFPHTSGQLLISVIKKAMTLDPAHRHQTARELKEEILAIERAWIWLAAVKSSAPEGTAWRELADGRIELSGAVANDGAKRAVDDAVASAPSGLYIVNLAHLTGSPGRTLPVSRPAPRLMGTLAWMAASAATAIALVLGAYALWYAEADTRPIYRSSPDVPFQVQIELPKTKYRIGEPFTFAVLASKDCNFLVYTVDAKDKVELHDPRVSGAFMGPPQLKAGERRDIPVRGAPGKAVINPPSGNHQIGAVCGRDDLAELGITTTQLRKPAQEGKRSFRFVLEQIATKINRERLSLATVAYEVE